jgi:hypothetical protein
MLSRSDKEWLERTVRFKMKVISNQLLKEDKPSPELLFQQAKEEVTKDIKYRFKSRNRFGSIISSILISIAVRIAIKLIEKWIKENLNVLSK